VETLFADTVYLTADYPDAPWATAVGACTRTCLAGGKLQVDRSHKGKLS